MRLFHTELLLLFPSGKKFLISKKPSILSHSKNNTEMEKMLAKKAYHINNN